MNGKFEPGDYVVYMRGDETQLGMVKRVNEDGAFVWYHSGDTAAHTPFHLLRKLSNPYMIKESLFNTADRK